MLKYSLETFGCKVNTYDGGLLEKRLSESGFERSKVDVAKVHILNTCAVTAEASREALRIARRLKRDHPDSKVVVTGCSAQVDTDLLAKESAIDLVVGNSHKGQLEYLVRDLISGEARVPRVSHSSIFTKDDLEAGGGVESDHTRSFLKIQDGCDSFCTFCVIPFARGKSRSLSPFELKNRILDLESQGVAEVVLTGVHIGDYDFRDDSTGLRWGLSQLIEFLLRETSIPRIRLSSLEPLELSRDLLGLYKANDRLCRHFHMSIQSATTRVLQAMKRVYVAEDVEDALERISSELPGSYVGMDVIAGFPGETRAEFEETRDRLARLAWTKLHVFPYSQRPKTFAARMREQVPAPEIVSRGRELRALSEERLHEILPLQVGLKKQVLRLRGHGALPAGLSRDYWTVQGEALAGSPGGEIEVTIRGFDPRTATLLA